MSITQSEIAKLAGVSRSTVSRILSDRTSSHKYNEKTIEKIHKIAREHNYQPNLLARSFYFQKTNTIGLVVTDISNPFWSTISYTVENLANKHNYNLIQCNTNDNQENEIRYINTLINRKVDGLIICPVQKKYTHLSDLAKLQYPFVLIDRYFKDFDTDYVVVNNIKGTYNAIKYLISIGHKKIAYIGGMPYTTSNSDRLEGYERALKSSGIPIDRSLVFQKDFTQNTGYSYIKLIFNNLQDKPTAIFAANNMIAIGALAALNEIKVRIPHDISFIMYDDVQVTINLWKVPITAVRIPLEKIAEEALNVLINKLSGKESRQREHIVLDPDLVIRKSCKSI